jgi:hypothetical protein
LGYASEEGGGASRAHGPRNGKRRKRCSGTVTECSPRQLRPHEIICICGQRGMGKSSFVRALIRSARAHLLLGPAFRVRGTLGGATVTVPEFEARERKGLLYSNVLRLCGQAIVLRHAGHGR